MWSQLASLTCDKSVFIIANGTGEEALDFSGFSVDQTIGLRASNEASTSSYCSSINGRAGNLSIAVGTVIESAIGGSAADAITGNSAANSIDGKAGNDTMAGGDGNHTYIVDSSSDVVTESLSVGSDLIEASVTYAAAANVEKLTLIGKGNFNATWNNLKNYLTGNSGDNSIDGGSFVVDSDGATPLDLPACCETVQIWDSSTPAAASIKPPSEDELLLRTLVLGVCNDARKCGLRRTLLGLSGGIDSALVAVIACCTGSR